MYMDPTRFFIKEAQIRRLSDPFRIIDICSCFALKLISNMTS